MNEKEQVTEMVDYMKMSHDLDVALGENREHTTNLQKACARINQLEAENKRYKDALARIYQLPSQQVKPVAVYAIEIAHEALQGPIPATLK